MICSHDEFNLANDCHRHEEQVSWLGRSRLRRPILVGRNASSEGQVSDAGLLLRADGNHVPGRGEWPPYISGNYP